VNRRIRSLALTITVASAIGMSGLFAGAASAATASAAGPAAASASGTVASSPLCVDTTSFHACASPEGLTAPITVLRSGYGSWSYPLTPGSTGEIKQAGLCMQLDHADGNIIEEAYCDQASFQEWEQVRESYFPVEFRSLWDLSLCLQYDNALGNILVAGPCVNTWYQWFYTN
jgi:hypothetical protein